VHRGGEVPRVTVLLPTLDAEAHLTSALDSLSRQAFTDFKVLILDGGSADRTLAIARAGWPFPLEIVQCGRIGLGAQLQIGLAKVQSEFVARMDADDICSAERFARQVEALENSTAVIVGAQIELLVGSKVCKAGTLPITHPAIRRALIAGFPAFCHPSVMFRTEAAIRCGGYRLSGAGEDLDFFLRITEHGLGSNLADHLLRYRLHGQSTSVKHFEEVKRNYRYAVACAAARRRGASEPTFEDFHTIWMRRNAIRRTMTRLECAGMTLYRASRERIACGQRFGGGVGAVLSILLRPGLLRTRALIQWDNLWNLIERT
jgi:glycosyltransferase involved in cell wall biosynthesis